MSKDNGEVSPLVKREIAKLITKEADIVIENTQQAIKYTEGEIFEQAKEKFQIKLIEQKIKELDKQKDLLKDRISDLGFEYNSFRKTYRGSGGGQVDPTTQAGKFFYMKVKSLDDIAELRNQVSTRLKKLWLCQDNASLKMIANEKIVVVALPKPKK